MAKESEFSMHVQHTYPPILKFHDETINCLIFNFLTLTDFSINLTSKIIMVLAGKDICMHKHVCVVWYSSFWMPRELKVTLGIATIR